MNVICRNRCHLQSLAHSLTQAVAQSHAKSAAWLIQGIFLLLFLLAQPLHAQQSITGDLSHLSPHPHRTLFFAKPESGVRVEQYEINLSFPDRQARRYLVPNDCAELLNEVNYGARRPDNILDRNLWFKAINDCRYVMIMPAEINIAETDHVSNYDFFNAQLKDLPFASQCKAVEEQEFIQQCRDQQPDKLSIRAFFPFLAIQPQSAADPNQKTEECRFYDGAFRGRLIRTAEGIRCQKDPRAHGLRLLSVDYGDLNYDNVQDVVLRIMPLGRGVSRLPILLPLTRKADHVPFSVPLGVPIDPFHTN